MKKIFVFTSLNFNDPESEVSAFIIDSDQTRDILSLVSEKMYSRVITVKHSQIKSFVHTHYTAFKWEFWEDGVHLNDVQVLDDPRRAKVGYELMKKFGMTLAPNLEALVDEYEIVFKKQMEEEYARQEAKKRKRIEERIKKKEEPARKRSKRVGEERSVHSARRVEEPIRARDITPEEEPRQEHAEPAAWNFNSGWSF